MTKKIGIITWIGEVKEHNGQKSLGLRIDNHEPFLNFYRTEEELTEYKYLLKKGYKIEVNFNGSIISSLHIISTDTTVKTKVSKLKIKNKEYDAEYAEIHGKKHILFGSLCRIAKEEGATGFKITDQYISEDFKKAWVKGKLVVKTYDGKEFEFEAIGSSTPENTGKLTSEYPIEMADTRCKGRAIRLFLGIGEAMNEEIKNE